MTALAVAFLVAFTIGMCARAGQSAAAGRTGLVDTAEHDRRGAWRGALVGAGSLAALAGVTAAALAMDLVNASQLAGAARTQAAVYAPYALALSLCLLAGRARHWKLRSWANALGVGGLDFIWPAVALLGVGLVVASGAGGAASGLSVVLPAITVVARPAVEWRWYRSLPARHY